MTASSWSHTSLRNDTNPVIHCLLASTSTVAGFPSIQDTCAFPLHSRIGRHRRPQEMFFHQVKQGRSGEQEEVEKTEGALGKTLRKIWQKEPHTRIWTGVPAKMSTCKNVHPTIPRQRILIRREMGAVRITSLNPKFNGSHFVVPPSSIHRMTGWVANSHILWRMRTAPISSVKCSPELVAHQPRTWAPNSLHFAHALHFAHVRPNLCLRFDCRSKGFAHDVSRSEPHACAHETSVLLNNLLHHNYCLSKEMHRISRVSKTQFMRIAHRRRWCNFQISSKCRYLIRIFFRHSPFNSVPFRPQQKWNNDFEWPALIPEIKNPRN